MTNQAFRATVAAACGAVSLAAFTDTAMTAGGSQDLAALLSGETLVSSDGSVVTFTPDGRFTGTTGNGTDFAGVWEIEDGLYCREVTEPASARFGDRRCQAVTVDGDAFTFDDVGSVRVGTWMRQS